MQKARKGTADSMLTRLEMRKTLFSLTGGLSIHLEDNILVVTTSKPISSSSTQNLSLSFVYRPLKINETFFTV